MARLARYRADDGTDGRAQNRTRSSVSRRGIVRSRATTLDRDYLNASAARLGIQALLERALTET